MDGVAALHLPAGSARWLRRDEISERTNEKEKPEAFLRGETHLRLCSGVIEAQPPTPQAIDKPQGNCQEARW